MNVYFLLFVAKKTMLITSLFLQVRLAETMKDLDDSQSLYNKLLVEKETHRQLAEKHVEDKEKLENQNNDLTG